MALLGAEAIRLLVLCRQMCWAAGSLHVVARWCVLSVCCDAEEAELRAGLQQREIRRREEDAVFAVEISEEVCGFDSDNEESNFECSGCSAVLLVRLPRTSFWRWSIKKWHIAGLFWGLQFEEQHSW